MSVIVSFHSLKTVWLFILHWLETASSHVRLELMVLRTHSYIILAILKHERIFGASAGSASNSEAS